MRRINSRHIMMEAKLANRDAIEKAKDATNSENGQYLMSTVEDPNVETRWQE